MAIDVSTIAKKYKGMWVAFKTDQKTVVASGRTAKVALEKAGCTDPILSRMPTRVISYIGYACILAAEGGA